MAAPRDKIQDMLCAQIDVLEATISESVTRLRNLHGLVNVMENRRLHEDEARAAATEARKLIDALADKLREPLKDTP